VALREDLKGVVLQPAGGAIRFAKAHRE